MDETFIRSVFGALRGSPSSAGTIVEGLARDGDIRSLETILDNDLIDLSKVRARSGGASDAHLGILPIVRSPRVDRATAKHLVLRWLTRSEVSLQETLDTLLHSATEVEDVDLLMEMGADPNWVLSEFKENAFAAAYVGDQYTKLGALIAHQRIRGDLPTYDGETSIFEKFADPGIQGAKVKGACRVMETLSLAPLPDRWCTHIADVLETIIEERQIGSLAMQNAGTDRYLWLMALAKPTAEQWSKLLYDFGDDFVRALTATREDFQHVELALKNIHASGYDLDSSICMTGDWDCVPLLHMAASRGNSKAVQCLLELGADPALEFASPGNTPRDACAYAAGSPETQALISAWRVRSAMRSTAPGIRSIG